MKWYGLQYIWDLDYEHLSLTLVHIERTTWTIMQMQQRSTAMALWTEQRSIKRAQIPVSKESAGLSRMDRQHPDGATLTSWAYDKARAWDVTIMNMFADSHLKDSSVIAGAAANHSAELKCTKYTDITFTLIFAPIAIETSESWKVESHRNNSGNWKANDQGNQRSQRNSL